MKSLQLCLSAGIVLALVLPSGQAKADDKEDGKKQAVRVVVVKAGDDGSKAIRIEGGSLEEVHRILAEKLKQLNDDNPKSERRIQLRVVGDDSAPREHDGEKKVERRIIRKSGAENAHDEHKHGQHDGEKKVEHRIVIGGADLHGFPKEFHAKIRAALAKHAHADDAKEGQVRVVILVQGDKRGVIELKEGLHGLTAGDHTVIRKKLDAHAVEVLKKAALARKQDAASVAAAKKVQENVRKKTESEDVRKKTESVIRARRSFARAKEAAAKSESATVRSFRRVEQGSSVDKRLDKIEGELKAIRKLLEDLRKRD